LTDDQRLRFDATELAVVLSHYDLGIIESITEFARGSRQSPKVGIVSERGKFLLKRRSATRARFDSVQFSHEVQSHLVATNFPVPRLIPVRGGGRTLLVRRGDAYELFEFAAGSDYQGTLGETHDAGAVLARFHRSAADLVTRNPIPTGDYHDHNGVRTGLRAVESKLTGHEGCEALIAELARAYNAAADRAERRGIKAQPRSVIHADWHPGNMLFRRDHVAAVIDFDSVRVSRRVIDIANGALQFSMPSKGDPAQWPDHLDEDRFAAFLAGYQSVAPIEHGERLCLPDLMEEAMIAECIPPISRTGRFGDCCGFGFLQMIRRKLAWLTGHRDQLVEAVSV